MIDFVFDIEPVWFLAIFIVLFQALENLLRSKASEAGVEEHVQGATKRPDRKAGDNDGSQSFFERVMNVNDGLDVTNLYDIPRPGWISLETAKQLKSIAEWLFTMYTGAKDIPRARLTAGHLLWTVLGRMKNSTLVKNPTSPKMFLYAGVSPVFL